jgi:hypothetical protein
MSGFDGLLSARSGRKGFLTDLLSMIGFQHGIKFGLGQFNVETPRATQIGCK